MELNEDHQTLRDNDLAIREPRPTKCEPVPPGPWILDPVAYRARLVHIPLVALLFSQRLNVLSGLFRRFSARFLHNLMQSHIHVFCHSRRVAAHIEMSAGLKPIVDIFALLEHSMLDVNLIDLVARKSGVEPG